MKANRSPPTIAAWLDLESESYLFKVKKMEAGGGHRTLMDDEWVHKGDKMQYLSVAYFPPRGSSPSIPHWPDSSTTPTLWRTPSSRRR